jgi:hypothetical protein
MQEIPRLLVDDGDNGVHVGLETHVKGANFVDAYENGG